MPPPSLTPTQERIRNLLFMREPTKWSVWPFLPLIRRLPGKEEECGLLYDVFNVHGRTGYSATVFLCNIFLLPERVEDLLTMPKETFDSVEEIYAAGWRID